MQATKAILVLLVLVAALSAEIIEGAVPARCKSHFQLLELQSPTGPRHTPFTDVFDAKSRVVDGQPLPNKQLFFHNKIYKGCDVDVKAPVIRPGGRVGIYQGHCVETYAPLKFIECYITWVFKDGTLSTNGPINLTAGTGILSINGGTGKYFAAKGEIAIEFGYIFPTKCRVDDADLVPSINTYTFCVDKPGISF